MTFSARKWCSAALERAQAADATFDLGAALRHFLALNVITGIEPSDADSRTRS